MVPSHGSQGLAWAKLGVSEAGRRPSHSGAHPRTLLPSCCHPPAQEGKGVQADPEEAELAGLGEQVAGHAHQLVAPRLRAPGMHQGAYGARLLGLMAYAHAYAHMPVGPLGPVGPFISAGYYSAVSKAVLRGPRCSLLMRWQVPRPGGVTHLLGLLVRAGHNSQHHVLGQDHLPRGAGAVRQGELSGGRLGAPVRLQAPGTRPLPRCCPSPFQDPAPLPSHCPASRMKKMTQGGLAGLLNRLPFAPSSTHDS